MMFRSISPILAISFMGITNAAEQSPRNIEDCLTQIGDKFSIGYRNLVREKIYLQQEISFISTSTHLSQAILPVHDKPTPSISLTDTQITKADTFLTCLDEIQSRISLIFSTFRQENAVLRRQRDQLEAAQTKERQTKKSTKLEEAPKLVGDPIFNSISEKALKLLSCLTTENRLLKAQLPSTSSIPTSTPNLLPAFPNREDYLTSSDYVGGIFDTLQAWITARFSVFYDENEGIRKLITSRQPTSSRAHGPLSEVKPFEQAITPVTVYPALEVRPKVFVRSSSTSTVRSSSRSAPSDGRQTTTSTMGLSPKRSPARNSTRSSIKDESEFGVYKLKLTAEVSEIIGEDQTLRSSFEGKLLQIKRDPEFLADNARKVLFKKLNEVDVTNHEDAARTITRILADGVSSPLVHRKDRKSRQDIEAEVESEKLRLLQLAEAEEREKDIQRVLDAIPSSLKSSDDNNLKKKVAQVVEGYKSGAIAIIQAGSGDPLAPLIQSLKGASKFERVTEILDSQIALITQNLERKARVDRSTHTRDFVIKGTFKYVPGTLSLHDVKHHGINLSTFDSHFYEHLKYLHPNLTVGSKLAELSTSPHSGLFVSEHIHVDSTDPFGVQYRLLILKTKHLVYNPSHWPVTSATVIPEHYTFSFAYYKLRVLQDQYEKLLQYTTPPHQLWHFPGVGVFAINGHDIVSFNVGQESMISGQEAKHFDRARILGTKDKVFNSDLTDSNKKDFK